MSLNHRPTRLLTAAGSAAVALTLGLSLASGPAPARADHLHGAPPGPIHAGSTFDWGKAPVNYRFVGALDRSQWTVRGPGSVRNQHGMLTLTTAKRGTISATENTRGRAVGRWEIRVRSRQYGHGGQAYRVVTELVPAGKRPEYCGAKNIALESYTLNKGPVTHYIRNRPDDHYVARTGIGLSNDRWHTFAVEVTRKRISWFVDAHVISTETREGALSGVPFAVRFTMEGVDGARMHRSRMQMDWLRYWTLRNPSSQSTKAPRPTLGRYHDGCGARR